MDVIAPMIATVVMMLVIGWIVKLVSQNKRLDKLARMHSELQTKVLDKLGSPEDVVAYLGTESGRRLLDAPVSERATPYGRILSSLQAGIILAVVGIGFLAVRGMVDIGDDAGLVFTGVLGLALGVGFLVSAFAAHAMSKSYGLINGRDGRES